MSGPHDLFARYTFGHPERAAAELRAVLPAHVVSEVDWESLKRESGSVVDPELRETETKGARGSLLFEPLPLFNIRVGGAYDLFGTGRTALPAAASARTLMPRLRGAARARCGCPS